LTKKNKLLINNEEVKLQDFNIMLDKASNKDRNKLILINGDKNIPYGKIMDIVNKIQSANYHSFILITEKN
jgi:biopolymer transport protein ExbD